MAKAAKTIQDRADRSPIRRHHSQRSTLIGLKLNKIAGHRIAGYAGDSRHDRKGYHLVRIVDEK